MNPPVSARKWRPQVFEAVVGQRHVTTALINALRAGKTAHAYLFSGIRGVGKTTLARLLAKGLNCTTQETTPCNQCNACMEMTRGQWTDVIEIDGASHTGVDHIRELRERAQYLPLRGRCKVYIIDEAHMLSNAAFNALLKILEEPPPHLVFILATTDPHKMPATILSRCQHFTLRRLTRQEIVDHLSAIARDNQAEISARALTAIARASEGSLRDALTLFDQALAYCGNKIAETDLELLLGRPPSEVPRHIVSALCARDAPAALKIARDLIDQGHDLRQVVSDVLEYLRHLMVSQHVPEEGGLIDLPTEDIAYIYAQAKNVSSEMLQRLFIVFAQLQNDLRGSLHPHLLLEVVLMRAILLADLKPVEQIIARLTQLGVPQAPPLGVPQAPPLSIPASPPAPESKPALSQEITGASLLEQIKRAHPVIGSYLEQGQGMEIEAQTIRVRFSEDRAFLVDMLQKTDRIAWLKTFVRNACKREIVLEVSQVAPPLLVTLPIQEDRREALQDALSDPVASALEIFGGKRIQ